jgi:hypothetical protein
MAIAFEDMSNSLTLTIPPISNKQVARRDIVTLKVLAYSRAGDLEGVTP